jgi:hypothetical protein
MKALHVLQMRSCVCARTAQGSLDAYLDPSYHVNRKRAHMNAFTAPAPATARGDVGGYDDDGENAPPYQPPQPKRSTATADNNTSSMQGVLKQASTAGTAPPPASGAPTTFAGLGLAARVGAGGCDASAAAAGSCAVDRVVAAAAAAAAAGAAGVRAEDNVLALILGPDGLTNSCMSVE